MARVPTQGQLLGPDPSLQKRRRIFSVLRLTEDFQSVAVTHYDDYRDIWIKSSYQFFPDWNFIYSEDYGYYRGYIHIAKTTNGNVKVNAGYCVCTIRSALVAAAFIAAFAFFYKNRAFKVA